MADAEQRRRARRVLRPDRRLRRPGRRAGRGVPVGRAGADEARRRRRRGATPSRRRPDRRRRRRRTSRRARRSGGRADRVTMRLAAARARRAAGSSCRVSGSSRTTPGARDRLAGRPVRPCPDRRLLRPRAAPAVLAQHGRRRRPASITIHFRVIGRGTEWFTHLRPGDTSTCSGRSAGRSRWTRAASTCCWSPAGSGMAGVRMLADEAIRDGRQVTLLFGAASPRDVYPSNLLPDEVEYVVATDDGSLGHHGFVTELVPDYEAWADQAFACGPAADAGGAGAAGGGTPRAARRRQARPQARRRQGRSVGSPAARRKAFLQVSMEQNMGCAVGACLGCVVMGVTGRRSGSAARGRSSPPRRSPGRARGREGWQSHARRRLRSTKRAVTATRPVRGALKAKRERSRRRLGRALAGRRPSDGRHIGARPRRPVARARRPATRRAESGDRRSAPTPVDLRSTSAAASSCRTRSSSPRGRSATASSTATSSTSTGSGRSAARARRSGRGSATRRRGSPRRRAGCSTRSACRTRASTPSSRSTPGRGPLAGAGHRQRRGRVGRRLRRGRAPPRRRARASPASS